MTDCIEQASFGTYFRKEIVDSKSSNPDYYKEFLSDWGSFYHKDDRYFAKRFLADVYKQLSIVIDNTNWIGDESWWISQKEHYDHFFNFDWSFENTIKSMTASRKNFGKDYRDS